MNKEDYEKLSSFEKIDYDIAMKIYFKHNDRIASINDHIGEMYDYSDLQDAIDCEKNDELNEYKMALKEKCDAIDKAIDYVEDNTVYFAEKDKHGNYLVNCESDELMSILKGEDNENKNNNSN